MKPVSFRYFAPRTVDDALDLLATHGEEGKILAGGQSLVPAMNFRLARPTSLIDINRIDALDYVREENGGLRVGALARHARFEAPVAGGAFAAFLPRVARHIGHLPIRSRGTFCGSVAHADPASEWCLLAATLDAEFVMVGRRGRCKVRPSEYFVTPELQCSSLSRRSILRWLLPRMPSYSSADASRSAARQPSCGRTKRCNTGRWRSANLTAFCRRGTVSHDHPAGMPVVQTPISSASRRLAKTFLLCRTQDGVLVRGA